MPVTNPPRVVDYDNAHLDLQTIEDVVNGPAEATVTSRLGRVIKTVANAIDSIVDGTAFIAKLFGVNFQPLYSDLKGKVGTDGSAFRIGGRLARNDGGQGVFLWRSGDQSVNVGADTQEIVWVAPNSAPSGASGAWQRDVAGQVLLSWTGASGDGVADDTAAVQGWIDMAVALGCRAVGSAGTFLTDGVSKNFATDLEIYLPAGCIIKGAAGYSDAVFLFDGQTARPRFKLTGAGTIDNSLRTYVPATASGTGLVLIRVSHLHIEGLAFKGDRATSKGDSGIALQECSAGVVAACRFIGQPDVGIYLTGGGSTAEADDYGDIKVYTNDYEDCEIAISARRQIGRTLILGNTIKSCGAGIQTAEAQSGATWLPPARTVIIIGNMGKDIEGAFIDARACEPGSLIANNSCEDWGVGSASAAIGLLGTQGVLCTGNNLKLVDVTPTTHSGITINNYTDGGGTVYTGQNNSVYTNNIIGANVGVRDLSTGPNFVGFNPMTDVTTPYTGLSNVPMNNENGFGIGVGSPQVPLHVGGTVRSERSGVADQYVQLEADAALSGMKTYSAPASAKKTRIDSRTNSAGDAPSGGTLGVQLAVNGVMYFEAGGDGLLARLASIPDHADDSAASAGGVAVGRLYRTGSTLKIRAA